MYNKTKIHTTRKKCGSYIEQKTTQNINKNILSKKNEQILYIYKLYKAKLQNELTQNKKLLVFTLR